MRSTIHFSVLFTALVIFVSCAGSNDKDYMDKSIIPAGTGSATNTPGTENAGVAPAGPIIPGIAPANNLTMQPVAGQLAAGTNPPHGQPGHRCDNPAAEMAPATTAQTTTITPQQPQVTMSEVKTTSKTAAGMNPPHGEPGHRCDISVGEPLSSKPAPANVQQGTTVTTQQPQVTTTQVSNPAQKTAPGMNPAHGEPGHRCDITVGAPLNSKPAATDAAPAKTATPPALLTPIKSGGKK